MFSVVDLAWKGWCIAQGGGGEHIAPVAVHCSSVLFHTTFLAGNQQLSGVFLPVLVQRQLLSWRRSRGKVAGLRGRRWRLMLDDAATSALEFLFDRAEVQRFLSFVQRCMLK